MAVFMAGSFATAQVIYENGPQVILPGGGVGGADVSHLHDGLSVYGYGVAQSSGFRIADEVVISDPGGWFIDSIAFYAYQTGSGLISTITGVNINIWNGAPDDPNSIVIFGDGVSNYMIETDWSGIYRTGDFTSTTCEPLTCDARPIMRNVITVGQNFPAGTYWLDFQVDGSGASGPWAPPICLPSPTTATGNAKQYDPNAGAWSDIIDNNATPPGAQGFPFDVVGSVLTGINDINVNNTVSVFPNPMAYTATVSINNHNLSAGQTYTFIMYDMLGNVVRRIEQIRDRQFTLERGSLSNGAYFYDMLVGTESLKRGKLVIR